VTTFQLFDSGVAEVTPDLFGVWEAAPGPPEGEVSFAAPGAEMPADEPPVWSVDLSPDLTHAAAELDTGLARLEASSGALAAAQSRLNALVARTQAQEAGVSFGVAAAEPDLPGPERELLRDLAQIKGGDEAVSFGLLSSRADLEAAEQQFKAVMERVGRSLVYYALVETKLEGVLQGRTSVAWSADSRTLWLAEARPEVLGLHRRSLALAIASRGTLIRTFALTAQGAVKLSALLAAPGGALLALPAAWKFVNQVLAEVRQYRELQNQN
jgi:hypothetical protein